jgi:TetR/AcrR family transcriptional repressor of mexJK operon
LFIQLGYERTTTLEIARVARVSKRTLYTCFGTKQGILDALIRSGSERMHAPLDLAAPDSVAGFFDALHRFGNVLLSELFSASKVAMYRLAIADASRSGVVARQLEESGSRPVIDAVRTLFEQAMQNGVIRFADPVLAVSAFFGVLVGEVHMRLVMGTIEPLTPAMIAKRVDMAVRTVEQLGLPAVAGR